MVYRLPDGGTMEYTHVATLPISGLSTEAMNIHIYPEINTSPLILLGVLCGDVCTIILDKKIMEVQNNRQKIQRGYRKKHTGMWEVLNTSSRTQ